MSLHWKDVLPIDQYVVTLPEEIDFYHIKVITTLYQPLIGAQACQLYMTLLFNRNDDHDLYRNHYHLMLQSSATLEVVYQERKKLEAIGLLSVYKKKEKEASQFIYELKRPLEPRSFFTDGVLNVYLYNRLGKADYLRLQRQLAPELLDKGDDYQEVTASFNDVFTSLKPSELKGFHHNHPSPPNLDKKTEAQPRLSIEFDFDQLKLDLSDVIISEKALTKPVEEAILQLAFVYQVGPSTMAQIIQQAFIHSGEIDVPTLRKAVRRYYQLENADQLPVLSLRAQEKSDEQENTEPQSGFEAQVRMFETLSPYTLLKTLSGGGEPVLSDLRIVEGLLMDLKLPPGVVNVLLDYTMRIKDKKLVKNYIEKIGSHWARKNIKNVREAMEIARSEHRSYQEFDVAQSPSSAQGYKKKKNTRKDSLPKWMTEDPGKTSKEETLPEERVKQLEDYLKSL